MVEHLAVVDIDIHWQLGLMLLIVSNRQFWRSVRLFRQVNLTASDMVRQL